MLIQYLDGPWRGIIITFIQANPSAVFQPAAGCNDAAVEHTGHPQPPRAADRISSLVTQERWWDDTCVICNHHLTQCSWLLVGPMYMYIVVCLLIWTWNPWNLYSKGEGFVHHQNFLSGDRYKILNYIWFKFVPHIWLMWGSFQLLAE